MANNDYITTDCKLTVSKNTAKLDEEIFLYKNDRNIKLLIEIVDNKYRYKSDDLSNLLVKYKASYAQVKWYKNAEVKKEFPIQATDDGKVVFVIEGQLIDEDTELGDYDLQLRLLNESQESIRSLPIIKGAVHILKPLFEEGDIATVNSAVADVSMLSLDGDAIDTYNSDGTYNQTNWGNGDVISSAKLNKLEKVAKDNVDKVNKMPAKSIVEGGKIYLAKEDGTKLDSGTELPAGGSTIEVVNNLESDSTTAALSAAQGKVLNTQYKDIASKFENGTIGNTIEPQLMDMPRIYFSEGTLPTSKTATMLKFDYYSKTKEYHGWAEIKCQGTSSMSYPKKNFTINLYKDKDKAKKLKIDFKGWGAQSKFCLKANWIDITHARNVVSAKIWGDVVKTRNDYTNLPELLRTSPNQGAIDGFPIIVYGNGGYQGRYTLNIPKDKWMSNMDDTLDTHGILCGENYVGACFRALPVIDGTDWTDELHDVVPAAIKTSWTNVVNFVMTSSDDEFKANLGNYINVNSLIDYLLYGIVSTGLDAFGKNQLFFTYDGIKWIASMYDMDSTWGLWWNGSKFVATDYAREDFQDLKDEGNGVAKQGNLLYLRLQQLFIPQLKTRYAELRKDVLSVSHIIQKFEEFNDVCPKDIVQEDYASTTGAGKFTGIPSKTTNNIQQLRSYINARLTYVDGYINALQEATPCTAITLDKTELQFTSLSMPDEVIDITKNASKGYSIIRGRWMIENQGLTFGGLRVSAPDTTTDFIPFTSNNTLTVAQPTSTYGCGVVAYDSDKKAISCYTANNTWEDGNTSATVDLTATSINIKNPPANTAYIRLCFSLTDLSNVIVTKKYSGAHQQLIPTVTPTDTTDKVVWSVSPTGIVTVNNGVVTPISNGTCIVTATCGSHSATCNVTVNLPSVACTSITLNKTALQLGTIEGTVPDTETNLIEGLTWRDGQLNDNTGAMNNGTDKCITDIKLPATGLYTLSATVNYNYFKIFIFDNSGELIGANMGGIGGKNISIYVYDPNCRISISLFPNSLSFDENNVSLKYVHSLANTTGKDVDIQASVIATPSLLTTSGDYKIIELYADTVYYDVSAIKLGSTIYKIINALTNLSAGQANISITRMNNGYCTKGEYKNKTLFNIAVPSTWGDTATDIVNYIQTNNIAVVINPSEYLNSADITGSTTINNYQLVPTVQPSTTTDVVVWSVSPEGIVTVNNGLVKAVSNGETVVTATCGTKSATCNVTVSNLSNISTINYELSEPLVCDGTSTYKDTNIKLLSQYNISKDWTMLVEFTPTQLPTGGNNSIVHCMNEGPPYPGVNIDISNNDRRVVIPNNNIIYTGPVPTINNSIQYALIKQGNLFTLYDNIGTVLGNLETAGNITSVNQTLLLGAYQDTSGNKGRFFNGTINKFKLVEEIYTVSQIKQYFSIVYSPIAYTLPQETTFNGTTDYVDTGIQLLKTDQNFTITMDVTPDTQTSTNVSLIHCMKEVSPYPGIVLQTSAGTDYFALSKGNNDIAITNLVPLEGRTKLVMVKNGTTMKVYTSNNIKGESPYTFTAIDQTLLLGAYQDVNGNKGRFFKGTVHEFSIIDAVYSNEQINAYLGVNIATD